MAFVAPNHPWILHIEATLYRQAYPARRTLSEVVQFVTAFESFVGQLNEPFAFVIDLSDVVSAQPGERKLLADSDKRQRAHDARYCAGVGMVAKTALLRGMITAIFWIHPPVYPYQICSSEQEAERWARAQLIAKGVSISPEPKTAPTMCA